MKGNFTFVALQSRSMLARSILIAESRGNSARAIETVADRGGGGKVVGGGSDAPSGYLYPELPPALHSPSPYVRRGGGDSVPIGARPSVQLRLGCVPPCLSEQRPVQLEERERRGSGVRPH